MRTEWTPEQVSPIEPRFYVQRTDRAYMILDMRGRALDGAPCAARAPWLFDSRALAERECAQRNHAALVAELS